jgi:hydrogenase maturation protein HypF
MADIRTVKALGESLDRMTEMLECEPQAVISDKHPLYNTVTFAEEYAGEHGIPLVQVQHHYAHILSCMAENAVSDGERLILHWFLDSLRFWRTRTRTSLTKP